MTSSRPPEEMEEDEEGTAVLSGLNYLVAGPHAEPQPFLVFVAGISAGRMVRLESDVVLGRGTGATVQLSGDGVSRLHTRIARRDGGVYVEDLGSTNGTLVNGAVIDGPTPLVDGDKIQIGAAFILKFSLQDEVDQRFQQELFEAAVRDPLTRAYNRRWLQERVDSDLAHSARREEPYALILLDLDFFKRINDRFGHPCGDHVLREFASLVERLTRREDFFARYGGEEFALACRTTSLAEGHHLAERIRARTEAQEFVFEGERIEVTVSAGVAVAWSGASFDELLACADEALYRAKEAGRNQVWSTEPRS